MKKYSIAVIIGDIKTINKIIYKFFQQNNPLSVSF